MREKEIRIKMPLKQEDINRLKTGDRVLLSGRMFTARDQAHKRMTTALKEGKKLPIDIKNEVVYYVGAAPAPPGFAIGSCGPTTSSRMDPFTPALLAKGLKGIIGKGNRSAEVIRKIKKHKAVYFVALGGAAALVARSVKKVLPVAYPDLGTEGIYELTVKDFPVFVGIDCRGNNIYKY